MDVIENGYQDSCRVCLVRNINDVQMAALFKTTINSLSISDMFCLCTTLSLDIDDGLPSLICTNCLANLISAYQFQTQCVKTDQELRIALGLMHKPDHLKVQNKESMAPDIKVELDASINENVLVSTISGGAVKEEEHTSRTEEHMFVQDSVQNVDDAEESAEHEEDWTESDNEFILPSKGKLKRERKKREKKQHICLVCNKVFDKAYRLARHSNVHNPHGRPFECDICKMRFASESSLIRHNIKHSGILQATTSRINEPPEIFKCRECPREFQKQESLSAHMKTHKLVSESRDYKCEYCPRMFSKLNQVTRHTKSHDEAKSHKCNICDRTFALGSHLIDHMNRHKGIKPHICPFCKKGFQQSCTLKDHVRTHNGETPFLCAECGKSFNNGSNLRQHALRHTGIKPFACNECPMRFNCRGGLKSHMGTHTGIKPYVCDLCGATFTKTYSLNKHKRIHTGERPYACEMCEMRFTSSDHVKRHMRTHTGEKPYKCKYCERAFAQSNDLIKHTRCHVGDNTYQCRDCPAAFRLLGELKKHGKIHFLAQKGIDQQGEPVLTKDDKVEAIELKIHQITDSQIHIPPAQNNINNIRPIIIKNEILIESLIKQPIEDAIKE